MARKMRENAAPMKFERVAIVHLQVTEEDAMHHLSAFIRRFIIETRRKRWIHCLLESPSKAAEQLTHFANDIDQKYAQPLTGINRFPQSLTSRFGNATGVFFAGTYPASRMTAAQAATYASEETADALLSIRAGYSVLCFDHEGNTWYCDAN